MNDDSNTTDTNPRGDAKPATGMTRGRLFAVSAAIGSALGLSQAAPVLAAAPSVASRHTASTTPDPRIVPFYGPHQAGIVSPQQSHTYFAAFDLTTTKRSDIIAMLQTWTDAIARMTSGKPVQTVTGAYDATKSIPDSGDALGLSPARLTVTVGFGAGLFTQDGADRYGLAAKRPAQFVDLPRFNGDQLIAGKTGGDISVQACADDPQVAFHAVRQLARLAGATAQLRWVQAGFLSGDPAAGTPRNLMGFKDGTQAPSDLAKFVWGGSEAPHWMQGGSYVVARRIRIALEHWDQMNVGFQEQTIGRSKVSGAPLGAKHEFDALPLNANDADGNPVIAQMAHVRLANASTNNGAQILRRGYSYNDGANVVAERWPPWRQAMEYDAGLLFISYQRDPATSFIPMLDKMSKMDMLNQFATHTGGGMFAVPRGIAHGEYLGQHLFEG
jgi:deferrochelatase/peroxidase EfeB